MELEKGLYVGCGLTQAPKEFKQNVVGIKEDLRQRGYDLLEFVGEKPATPAEVYLWDIEQCVSRCGAMLAIADHPSLGLGWEMATASELSIPTLIVARVGRSISRLVLGAAEVIPSFEFQRYEHFSDIPNQLDQFLEQPVKQLAD